MIQEGRLFIFEYKLGPFDVFRLVFYSKNPRYTYNDFRNALIQTLLKIKKKYNKRNVYTMMRLPNLVREINIEMNKLGFAPVSKYNYIDLNELLQELAMG